MRLERLPDRRTVATKMIDPDGTAVPLFSFQDSCSEQVVAVAKKDDKEEVAPLERLNGELGKGLQRCRHLLQEYEARLAATSSEAEVGDAGKETRGS